MDITEYKPRSCFKPLHLRDKRWTVVVAHRRAGKTVSVCAELIFGAMETALHRPQFAYLAPQREQAKRVAWGYLKELSEPLWVKKPNEAELRIEIENAHGGTSTIYVGGADNPDSMRGLYLDGVALDEFGDMRPSVWLSVLRPALSDRGGWAVFMGTPRGRNMFWSMREEARLNPDSYLLMELPASKTKIIDPVELEEAKAQMTEESFAIEYECSFDASIPGAYFARDIGYLYEKQMIGNGANFQRDPEFPIYVAGDLGFSDTCAWWVWQKAPDGYRIVDYYESNGQPIAHYIEWIHSLGNVEEVWLPHDARAKSLQTGRSIIEVFLSAGITPKLIPKMKLQDSIEAGRQILKKCWFNESKCYEGLEHLKAYCRMWNEKTGAFSERPNHDAHSHAADAFRYMACCVQDTLPLEVQTPEYAKEDFINKQTYNFSLEDLYLNRPERIRRI